MNITPNTSLKNKDNGAIAVAETTSLQSENRQHIVYRIYYGEELVYIGRTSQPLQNRIRTHIMGIPMVRKLEIDKISKIEYINLKTEADMFLYEIYFINLWHPKLNRDDKAKDELTVSLPDVEWKEFSTKLWENWKQKVKDQTTEAQLRKETRAQLMSKRQEMRDKWKSGEISEEEYYEFIDEFHLLIQGRYM